MQYIIIIIIIIIKNNQIYFFSYTFLFCLFLFSDILPNHHSNHLKSDIKNA